MSTGGRQSDERSSSFVRNDEFNLMRSLYDIPNRDVSRLLEDQDGNFSQNLENFDSSERPGANGSSAMFQNMTSFPSPGQSLPCSLEQQIHPLPSNSPQTNGYEMTPYETWLYEQYARKEEEKEDENALNPTSNTHSSNTNTNYRTMNESSDQYSNLHNCSETNNNDGENQHEDSMRLEPPLASPIDHNLPSSSSQTSLNANSEASRIIKPTIFEGKQNQTFPPSLHLVEPTVVPTIYIPQIPLLDTWRGTKVPEYMIGELLGETFTHATGSKSKSTTSNILQTNDNARHSIRCSHCHSDFLVHKLASLVSCPSCGAVFPNSRYGKGIQYLNGSTYD